LNQNHKTGTSDCREAHHLGVWPPRMSVLVFLASLPRRAAQYGSCLPMVLRFGRFFARSTTSTSVPMTGPSTLRSEKMPAVCAPLRGLVFVLDDIAGCGGARVCLLVGGRKHGTREAASRGPNAGEFVCRQDAASCSFMRLFERRERQHAVGRLIVVAGMLEDN
jgi:hypothetical protein